MSEHSGRILAVKEVAAEIGLSKATINRLHRAGNFPRKVILSANRTGWFESDIQAWKKSRPEVEIPN